MLMPSTPPSHQKYASPFISAALHQLHNPSLTHSPHQLLATAEEETYDSAERYHTCCGLVHVELAALLVALFSATTNGLYLVGCALSGAFEHQVWWCNTAMVAVSVVLVVGQWLRLPALYIVYLVVNAVNVLLHAAFLFILLAFIAVFDPNNGAGDGAGRSNSFPRHGASGGKADNSSNTALDGSPTVQQYSLLDEWKSHLVMVVTALYLLHMAISLWYEWVVYRAYKFVCTAQQWKHSEKATQVSVKGRGESGGKIAVGRALNGSAKKATHFSLDKVSPASRFK